MKILRKIIKNTLEFIFPSTFIEKQVREMDLEDFSALKKLDLSDDGVISFFKYKDPLVRETIRQFKYRKSSRIIIILAEIIYSSLLEEISDLSLFENFEKPILVPVPMSKKEKRERGYNQIELLIKEISKIDNKNFSYNFNFLRKTKEHPRQTNLKREERLKNVSGVFKSIPDVRGKNIILIDDVRTTGATLTEAKMTLEKSGTKRVLAVVIAR